MNQPKPGAGLVLTALMLILLMGVAGWWLWPLAEPVYQGKRLQKNVRGRSEG